MKSVSDWLYSFANYIELEVEEADSLQKLRQFVQNERSNDKIHHGLIDFTLEYITCGFEDQLYRLSHRHVTCTVMEVTLVITVSASQVIRHCQEI